jgi:hypothetical protein
MNGKKLLALFSGLAVASTVSTLVVNAQLNQPREVPAFSYSMEFFEYDENGAKKYTHTDHYGVRGDGSSAMVDDSLLASMGERRVTVSDYTERVGWVTSLFGRTVTTLPMAERVVPRVHYEQCDEGEVGTIASYEVRQQRNIMRNQETGEVFWILERWRAPELGCVALRTARYDKNEKLTHDRIATNILLGEPDPTLFQVPEGYVESSPMQAQQKLVDLGADSPFGEDALDIVERAERRYWDSR